MNCVRCKEPIDENSNFCNKCGMEQNAEIRPMEEDPSQNKKKGWSTKKVIAVIGITLFFIFFIPPFIDGFIEGWNQARIDSEQYYDDGYYDDGYYNDGYYDDGYYDDGYYDDGYYDDGYNQDLEDFFDQDYDGFWDP
jgi:hypothetical protein